MECVASWYCVRFYLQPRFYVGLYSGLSEVSVLMLERFDSLHERQLGVEVCAVVCVGVETRRVGVRDSTGAGRSANAGVTDCLYVMLVAPLNAL